MASTEGDSVVARIQLYTQEIERTRDGIEASEQRTAFQRDCIASLFPLIYNDEWKAHENDILERHGRVTAPAHATFVGNRVSGKTTTVATLLAAVFYSWTGAPLRVAVFVRFRAQGSILINIIHRAICQLPGGADMCERSEKELCVWKRGASHADTIPSRLSVVSTGNAARGIQPDLVVMDWTVFTDEEFVLNTALPMLMSRRCAVWSTATGPLGPRHQSVLEALDMCRADSLSQ